MRRLRWAVVSVVAVAAGAGLTGMYVATRYEARIGQMVRETIAERDRLYDLLHDPATNLIDLRGLGGAPAAGRVVWNDTRGGVLLASGLPPAPAGKTYAAWTISGGAPRSAGLVRVDARGRAAHRIEPTDRAVDAFSVSLELEGRMTSPTEPVVLTSR